MTISVPAGFVLVGNACDDRCAVNTIHSSLTRQNNTAGVEAIATHLAGAISATGSSGAGPQQEDTVVDIARNGP